MAPLTVTGSVAASDRATPPTRTVNAAAAGTEAVSSVSSKVSTRVSAFTVAASSPTPCRIVTAAAADSGRPSLVHTASAASQSVVAGRFTVTSPPDGSMVISHSALSTLSVTGSRSLSTRRASDTRPLVTPRSRSFIVPHPTPTGSLNCSSRTNGSPPCAGGEPPKLAVRSSGSWL